MTALSTEPPVWSWRRWCLLIALTLCVQLGLIFALGDRSPPRVRQPSPAPKLAVLGNSSSEIIALTDPTLFALPHQVGFSGSAWMKGSYVPPRTNDWTEEPRYLALSAEQLGKVSVPLETGTPGPLPSFIAFEPESTAPELFLTSSFRQKSTFRLGEGLEHRRLKTVPKLPSWPYSDFLTNTVVKLFIDGNGSPVSAPALLFSSGLKAADDCALSQASAARFDPVLNEGPNRSRNRLANSTWGIIVFEWHTLPLSATNAGVANPQ